MRCPPVRKCFAHYLFEHLHLVLPSDLFLAGLGGLRFHLGLEVSAEHQLPSDFLPVADEVVHRQVGLDPPQLSRDVPLSNAVFVQQVSALGLVDHHLEQSIHVLLYFFVSGCLSAPNFLDQFDLVLVHYLTSHESFDLLVEVYLFFKGDLGGFVGSSHLLGLLLQLDGRHVIDGLIFGIQEVHFIVLEVELLLECSDGGRPRVHLLPDPLLYEHLGFDNPGEVGGLFLLVDEVADYFRLEFVDHLVLGDALQPRKH